MMTVAEILWLLIGFGTGAILGGAFVHRWRARDRNVFIDELVKVHQQRMAHEREAAVWHQKYLQAVAAMRVDVYHHQDDVLPGDEWKTRGGPN